MLGIAGDHLTMRTRRTRFRTAVKLDTGFFHRTFVVIPRRTMLNHRIVVRSRDGDGHFLRINTTMFITHRHLIRQCHGLTFGQRLG